MGTSEKTFGQFVRNIIEKRNISIRRLSALMKMKSKTGIQRIVEDESSYRSIVRFAQQLEEILDLDDKEKHEMEAAVRLHKIPSDVRAARLTLRNLITAADSVGKTCRCTFMNGDEFCGTAYLDELLITAARLPEHGNVSIYAENVTFPELIYALKKIAESKNADNLKIYHLFRDTNDKCELGEQLLALYTLAPFTEYYPYSLPKNLVKNRRIMMFCDGNGTSHLFNIYTKSGFGYLCEKTSPATQRHLRAEYDRLIEKSGSMTKERFSVPMENLPNYLNEQLSIDDLSAVSLESTVCFMFIPFEIQKRLYEDSEYMGLGKDDPTIIRMYKVLEARSKKIYTSGIDRTCVYSRAILERFIKSGMTEDYFPFFRPLTKAETTETLEAVLSIKKFRLYLLRDGYSSGQLTLASFESKFISAVDPKGGYWKNYSQINITNPDMAAVLDDFILNDVIPNCCYSEEESRKIVTELIAEAKKSNTAD